MPILTAGRRDGYHLGKVFTKPDVTSLPSSAAPYRAASHLPTACPVRPGVPARVFTGVMGPPRV